MALQRKNSLNSEMFPREDRLAAADIKGTGRGDQRSDAMARTSSQTAEIEQESSDVSSFQEAAENAGLRYVSDDAPGIRRVRRGKRFSYFQANGDPVRDPATLERIRKLAIPPAYDDVWICAQANGHLQASGRDAKGRKQYRYHEQFRAARDSSKYEHILEFAAVLPRIRATVDEHMSLRGLPREKALATIIHLLETTMIRVGNSRYATANKSYGLSTMRDRHVAIEGQELRFSFKGKSGKRWRLNVRDRRVARIVKKMQDLPGQHLFQYLDMEGVQREVTSGDINRYLKEVAGADVTSKDFRTWTGSILAATGLIQVGPASSETAAKRKVRDVVQAVSGVLGNTPTVCRKCYIHPEIIDAYLTGELRLRVTAPSDEEADVAQLSPEEQAVLRFLKRRLARKSASLAA